MKKLIQYCALFGTVVLAGEASAATGNVLTGSDTMDVLTSNVIAACPGAAGLSYTGGGSGTGEQNMMLLKQETAPMSRALQASRTCRSGNPEAAQCKVVALDGIAIVAGATTNGGSCNGVSVAGQTIPTTSYTLNGPFDALRLIYAGMDQNAGSDITKKDCSNATRKALINNWGSIFTAGCTSGTCTKLSHAYRRGDASGTTDTFLTLLGLPAPIPTTPVANQTNTQPNPYPANPFCNGWERDDQDPVRSTCGSGATAADTVCNITAGVVLPVVVPEQLSATQAYPTKTCDTGKFALEPARRTLLSGGTTLFECPEGTFAAGKSSESGSTYSIGGFCYAPYHLNGTTKEFDCLNNRTNHSPAGADGLAENRFLRSTTGALVNDSAGVPVANAYYRMRNGACTQTSSTQDIGCLAANVACSIGYSGREADTAASPALSIDGIFPTTASIQALVQTPPPVPVYPIARRLNDCSMKGLANVTDTLEQGLAACFQNQSITGPIIDAAGFVRLPSGAVSCVDFDETSCTANNATAVVTCTTNADCGVFSCVSGKCDFTCAGDGDCSAKQPGSSCIAGHCGFAAGSNSNACL
jgi:ABC-type phosphate transport system substrate-binding protein